MSHPGAHLEQRLLQALEQGDWPRSPAGLSPEKAGLSAPALVELFESQLLSRHLDYTARRLQARGLGYYTIGSAGHEGNAAIAAALRVSDPAFLHYRDAAFFLQRARGLPGQTPVWDMLLSFCASSEDPVSGGRHKVLGSRTLNIPPQTSTIASHLPKAVGAAYSLGLWKRLHGEGDWPADSIVVCSFGDASFNHSTAQGALNSAAWSAHQGVPVPLLAICEDNGLGISVPTPRGWIETAMRGRAGWEYLACDGLDLLDSYRAAREAAEIVRRQRRPVFLHMSCVRLLGHAGSDAETAYRSASQISADEARDPLLHSAGQLIDHGILGAEQIVALYRETAERVARVAEEAARRPRLVSANQVMSSIVPPRRPASGAPDGSVDAEAHSMARLLNRSLDRILTGYRNAFLAGEDIGRKGGVYGVTQRLQARHGAHRVIDSLLDEQSILGLGIGAAHNRLLPILEIQFLAYLHNAEDQLRGEAATLSFFSRGQFTNPMVVRIAGLGYQRGFGGHFHNDNALAVLRDIPGLLVACPATPADAVGLLQEAVRLADEEQRVVVMIEPIARYHCRDLHAPDDGLWCETDPGPDYRIAVGEFSLQGDGRDLALISYGNGVYLARQAQQKLSEQGVSSRLLNLRWLNGIDHARLHAAVADCRRVLVIDECRRSGSVSEEICTELGSRGLAWPRLGRLTAEDSFIPLGPAATSTLPDVAGIVGAGLELLEHPDR